MNIIKIKICFLSLALILLHSVKINLLFTISDYIYIFGILYLSLIDFINTDKLYIIDLAIASIISNIIDNYNISHTNPVILIFIIIYFIILLNTQYKKNRYGIFFILLIIILLFKFFS